LRKQEKAILSNILKQAHLENLRNLQQHCMAAVGQTGGWGVGLGVKE